MQDNSHNCSDSTNSHSADNSGPKFNAEFIDGLVAKVSALLSNAGVATNLKEDLQRNLRVVVQNSFSKLDLVSREEFDAQVAVLSRSREKIEALEQQLAALTEQLNT